MKKNTIIAGAVIAAIAGGVAYFLWRKRKGNQPLLEEFDAHYQNDIAPRVKKTVKHVTNAFKNAKDHLTEAGHNHDVQQA